MKAGRGTLGVCLAKQSQGGDPDKLACGLKKRSQKRNPSPSVVPSWTDQPVADSHGKSRATVAAASEMKHGQSEASLLCHGGFKVLQSLKGSMGRNSAPAASLGKAVALSPAPSEEQLAGVSRGIGDALGSDWPGREPRATDNCGLYLKGESWVSGRPGHPKLREVRFLRGDPLSAVPKGLGTWSELSHRYSELCQLPYAYPYYKVLPEDELRCVSLDRFNPVLSEETVKDEKALKYFRWSADSCGVTGSAIFQISKSLMP
ncbi:protein FAM220A isoform X1 [Mus caroli]|uniref:Protein FAM220A isoform X1 n=1 Tax=Mus caroli TaxID=10089 RepID=A0A6P7RA82_MUSCR|nr:protein FAM220A isoform X1 [Mus caroli]XP_029333834.1 protein FAM220A isoform X1 [Mus caroli]XP_029333835.1 protein FAM220A isoform X1 [Mus caroli]XP_029333836.1 protein FAM220A isoform X1 [Mus caroli]